MSVTESEVYTYFDCLSNWGRWGDEDTRGTLNLIADGKCAQSVRLVTAGKSIGCGRIISPRGRQDPVGPVVHFMTNSGESAPMEGPSAAADWLGLPLHGTELTHIDAPSHVFWDGHMYNKRPAKLVSTSAGAKAGNLDPLFDGVVTRGVLFDIPRYRAAEYVPAEDYVSVSELQKYETEFGIEVQPGDAVLIRVGADAYRRALPSADPRLSYPGLHPDVLPWLHERDVAILASDAVNDPNPPVFPGLPSPIHYVGIVAMGLWLIDNAALDRVAAEAAQRSTHAFQFTVAALPIKNGTGSPVNPIATF